MFDYKGSSAAKIKEYIKTKDIEEYPALIEEMQDDTRKAVKNICASLEKKYSKYKKELERVSSIKELENELYEEGARYIAGLDEVGRGPLAGPVVTAAVIMPKDSSILYINDSKKLSKKKREELSEKIKQEAISYSIGIKDNKVIDRENILNATKHAMLDAIDGLSVKPDILVIDAVHLDTDIRQESLVKGDERVYSIAAASIVAKVYRDNLMDEYAKEYPEYGFESNKGYGTFEHTMAIKEHGLCKIHRRSFTSNFVTDTEYEEKRIAYNALKEDGYELKDYDYECKYGNIDVIGTNNNVLTFISIGKEFGEDEIGSIIKSGKNYIRSNEVKEELCRFDQVIVDGETAEIRRNVFVK